ncbi:efflux RND transporter periplasmic adaptor subunit [Ferriphaselus sp. R-1]|uniref:efflux RND transporter periplasmic adaptor subunit n=1 Tax=Ferriphaselus sp. R-1 TaxID=1485544 RepID=UPI00054DD510|nr:efflux RND transporter periplasmic adaptor subunit [Ferriphaselus sp. R-1]
MPLSPTVKKILLASTVLGIVAAAVWLLPRSSSPNPRYLTEAVERGALTQTVSANGTLNPVTLVSVGSQVSGIVKSLHADFNDHVTAGQVLLELDPALVQAQAQQSAASVASARASLDLAQANEARIRSLYAQEYASRQELETAVQALKAARAQLTLTEAQAARDRTNLGYTQIRSPVSGVVVSRQIDVGQTVAASFQAPVLFQIAQDLSKMQINSSFAEADIGNIRAGQPASFTVDAFPGRQFKGLVRQVRLNPTTQQNVVTYNVVIDVDNPDSLLLPGMTAYVGVVTAEKTEVLKVPNAALRFRPEGAERANRKNGAQKKGLPVQPGTLRGSVYVLDAEKLKQIPLLVGASDGKFSVVVEGELKAGDAVVVEDTQPDKSAKSNASAPPIRLQ